MYVMIHRIKPLSLSCVSRGRATLPLRTLLEYPPTALWELSRKWDEYARRDEKREKNIVEREKLEHTESDDVSGGVDGGRDYLFNFT